jgi:acyl-CoA synthetase (AMP-forming)/AMP-acid ligase II
VAGTLLSSGGLRAARPDRPARALASLRRWGLTPPGAYAVAARLDPHRAAIVDELGTLSFAEVHRRTSSLAHSLRAAGIEEGDGVALMCRNHRAFVEATVACSKLGANVVYLDTGFGEHEVVEAIRREDPVALIYDEEFTGILHGWRPGGLKHFVALCGEGHSPEDPTLEELIARECTARLRPPRARGGVTISRSSANPTETAATRRLPSSLLPTAKLLREIPFRARETTVLAAPMFHPWGFLHLTLGLRLASTLVLRRRFDPADTLRAAAEHEASALALLPAMLQSIARLPAECFAQQGLGRLRVIAVPGATPQHELAMLAMKTSGTVLYSLRGPGEPRSEGGCCDAEH